MAGPLRSERHVSDRYFLTFCGNYLRKAASSSLGVFLSACNLTTATLIVFELPSAFALTVTRRPSIRLREIGLTTFQTRLSLSLTSVFPSEPTTPEIVIVLFDDFSLDELSRCAARTGKASRIRRARQEIEVVRFMVPPCPGSFLTS